LVADCAAVVQLAYDVDRQVLDAAVYPPKSGCVAGVAAELAASAGLFYGRGDWRV
jgi:hypothetical protein